MKLKCTPSDRCVPEQSIQRKTPYVMLAQLGFFDPQSKHTLKKTKIINLTYAQSPLVAVLWVILTPLQ